ncbi:hypothetical protein BAUCODRAFT_95278, partial [Baudoinia panamericana UAMH 10762]
MNYTERLATFQGFWDEDDDTARQLAASGHVYDRPPLEALEQGSRCIICGQFVRRDSSIVALSSTPGFETTLWENYHASSSKNFTFHHPRCPMEQCRMPLEPRATMPGFYGDRGTKALPRQWYRRKDRLPSSFDPPTKRQASPFFALPVELRLTIYTMVLPQLGNAANVPWSERVTEINILRTCAQIRNEALDVLYTGHTFKFANCKTLYMFLRNIGKNGRDLLQAVDTYCRSREDSITFSLLASCPRLRTITIRYPYPRLLIPGAP